jgi:hypothetical protein
VGVPLFCVTCGEPREDTSPSLSAWCTTCKADTVWTTLRPCQSRFTYNDRRFLRSLKIDPEEDDYR